MNETTDSMADAVGPVAGDGGETDTAGTDAGTGETGLVVDLRPAAESVQDELLRLGLAFDHVDGTRGVEVWRCYSRHLMAEFPTSDPVSVTLTDLRSGIGRTLGQDELRDVARIIVSGERE